MTTKNIEESCPTSCAPPGDGFIRTFARRTIKRPLEATLQRWSEAREKKAVFAESASLVPPLRLMHDGIADYRAFKENGEEFATILKEKAGLTPSSRMLDVGCGIGRKTLPLLNYLTPPMGRYVGIDIVRTGVEWCQTHITPQYPHFRFELMDVYNGFYNPKSLTKACEYRFPFPDESFDVILLGSVFTHTLMEDTLHYLSEIHRLLRDGGRALISYFLLNPESKRLMQLGKSEHCFAHDIGRCKVVDSTVPEVAVAYEEEDILSAYHQLGLQTAGQVYYGSWSGRNDYLSFQDLIVGTKSAR